MIPLFAYLGPTKEKEKDKEINIPAPKRHQYLSVLLDEEKKEKKIKEFRAEQGKVEAEEGGESLPEVVVSGPTEGVNGSGEGVGESDNEREEMKEEEVHAEAAVAMKGEGGEGEGEVVTTTTTNGDVEMA